MQELPDYLPLFLEFLSQMAPDEARKLLKDSAHILAAIHARLAKRDSPYAVIFAALLFLADTKVAPMEVTEDDDSPEALDRAWEEAAVSFGPEGFAGAGQGCSRATGMLRRMNLS
jgi:nitrate reductase delta subunit